MLFTLLAAGILGNAISAIVVVGCTAVLLLITLVCLGVVVALARVRVPARLTARRMSISVILLGAGVGLSLVAPAVGGLFLALVGLGLVLPLLPRIWRANVTLALRNVGRQPARSATMLVALFIGVFAIGVVLILGQDVRANISQALNAQLRYNTYLSVGAGDHDAVEQVVRQ